MRRNQAALSANDFREKPNLNLPSAASRSNGPSQPQACLPSPRSASPQLLEERGCPRPCFTGPIFLSLDFSVWFREAGTLTAIVRHD